MPALAKAMAMPLPMVPKPTTPAVRIGRTGARGSMPATFGASRSAKNTWRSARDSGPPSSSLNTSRSWASPAANGIASVATMHSSAACGARRPRASRRSFSAACASIAASAAGAARAPVGRVGCAAALRAKAMARARSSSRPATRSTMPAPAASLAPMARPLRMRSSASGRPARRGSRWVPPAPGMKPRVTSGRLMARSFAATR